VVLPCFKYVFQYRNYFPEMFLSCCKDFAESSNEAGCQPFFATQSNILSLLNCPGIIKKYGSLGGIWEGEDEAFVRCVKSEISTMRYQISHLLSVLVRLLKTKSLNYLDQNNSLNKCKEYSRTNDVRIYSKRTCHVEALTILEQEVFVSGIHQPHGKSCNMHGGKCWEGYQTDTPDL